MITLAAPTKTESGADAAVCTEGLPHDLRDEHVFVDATSMDITTQFFASGLVYDVLGTKGAARLTVSNPTISFSRRLIAASMTHKVEDKLVIQMNG